MGHDADVVLEHASCCVCSSEPEAVVRRARSWLDTVGGTYDVRACGRCGMWITSPRPRREDLHKVYPPGYHQRVLPDPEPATEARSRGRLLDVGCGVGNYLVSARNEGWSCVGVEISEEAARTARARGFDVVVGDAGELDLGEAKFDLVRCAHTLEHLPEPAHVLAKLARAVKPDGEIAVIVPNRGSLTSLLFRRYWYHLDVPRHLSHFRRRDIERLAAQTGLTVRSVRHAASPTGLLGSIDCLLAGRAGRATRFRTRGGLRRLAQAATAPIALLHLADVVEYRLARRSRNGDG